MNVFISSTCFDLIDLRQELKQFLKSKGLNPIMSDELDTEFRTPGDQNSIETCLVNLRNSDVIVVILSKRYGPSLHKAGFEDVSATHLEYKEAVKLKKKLLVFVRDRLEGEMNAFRKAKKNPAVLSWIEPKDVKIFEIIDEHKKLANDTKNNWYWLFKSSVDIKTRLEIEFSAQISDARLNYLMTKGDLPFLSITSTPNYNIGRKRIEIGITAENLGNLSAIEPIVVIYQSASYDEVMATEINDIPSMEKKHSKWVSLKPLEKSDKFMLTQSLEGQYLNKKSFSYIVEIIYRTINGDILCDISRLNLEITKDPPLKPSTDQIHLKKRNRGENFYRQLRKP